MKRGIFFAVLALLLLALDYAFSPNLVEDRRVAEHLSANRVWNGDVVTMGTYHLNRLSVSRGRIEDENYVRKLRPVDALAITAFSPGPAGSVGIGSLADAVKMSLAPADAKALVALISDTPRLAPGKVQVLPLTEAQSAGSLAGIKFLIVLRAKRGSDREAKEALKNGLKRVLEQAEKHAVSGLILPTLTVAPEQDTPSFDDFFAALFEAMRESKGPRRVEVSFFEKWQASDVEAATVAFNDQWETTMEKLEGALATLHRFQFRLLLIGLAFCFLASSRYVTLGLKSAVILATAYTLTLLGAFKTVETIMAGLDRTSVGVALIATALVLAILFPRIVTWSVKDLFAGGAQSGHR